MRFDIIDKMSVTISHLTAMLFECYN